MHYLEVWDTELQSISKGFDIITNCHGASCVQANDAEGQKE